MCFEAEVVGAVLTGTDDGARRSDERRTVVNKDLSCRTIQVDRRLPVNLRKRLTANGRIRQYAARCERTGPSLGLNGGGCLCGGRQEP